MKSYNDFCVSENNKMDFSLFHLNLLNVGNKVQAGKNGPANPAPTNNIEGLKWEMEEERFH